MKIKLLKRLVKKNGLCYNCGAGIGRTQNKEGRTNTMVGFGEVNSVDFAIYLYKKAAEAEKHINITKIQKWLYICYGLHLAVEGRQLFDEKPQAWDYGPFFPDVHGAQKLLANDLSRLEFRIENVDFSKYDKLINATLKHFGDWNAGQLVDWTHKKNTAWYKQTKAGEKYGEMNNDNILSDFERLFPK